MPKQTPELDWQIVENDEEWERQRALFPPEGVTTNSSPPRIRRIWLGMAMLFLLLTGAGDWWWRATQGQADQAAATAPAQQGFTPGKLDLAALVASIKQNHEMMNGWYELGQRGDDLRAAIVAADPTAHLGLTVQAVNAQDDQAEVEVVTYDKQNVPAYRQTRFYRWTNAGWQRTAPDATLWGPEQSLTTPYFLYHFRERDATTVLAVAPQMDALYITLWRNFGLPILPTPDKLVIDVSVTQPPGQVSSWFAGPNHIAVSSPALYLAPVGLTDAVLLTQSLALPLLDHVLTQAVQVHPIGAPWQPLLNGLRLWQMWDWDLPLAARRHDIVQWLYADVPRTAIAPDLPAYYAEFCALHPLWTPNPWQLPLECGKGTQDTGRAAWWRQRDLPRRLSQLAVPLSPRLSIQTGSVPEQITYPGQAVALATLIEYAVAAYGRERLPVLLVGLGQYASWEALLPAVYGISSAQFEAGWQAYLAAHYGVSIH